ncbi:MAG: T9SS type A sorting domain-containing protein, partial [Bacteroidota bacterium]
SADFSYTRAGNSTRFTFDQEVLSAPNVINLEHTWTLYRDNIQISSNSVVVPATPTPSTQSWATNIPVQCGNYKIVNQVNGLDSNGALVCSSSRSEEICIRYITIGFMALICPDCQNSWWPSHRLAGTEGYDLFWVASQQDKRSAKLTFTTNSAIEGEANVQLIDLSGKIVQEADIRIEANLQQHKLPIANLSSGMYLLRLGDGTQWLSKKVLLQ